jgi:hypothetical protein
VRYDIDAGGNFQGIFLAHFTTPSLGTICMTGTLAFGAFAPGSSFPPANGTLASIGGTGLASWLRLTLKAQVSDVTETLDTGYHLTGAGSATITAGKAKPLDADCLALSRLG